MIQFSDPSDSGEPVDFTVGPDEAAERFDQILSNHRLASSRNQASRMIRAGYFSVNEKIKKPAYRLSAGDRITGQTPASYRSGNAPGSVAVAESVAIDVLHEDSACIVVNKPPGIVVHPAPGHFTGTLANGLLYRYPELANIGASPDRPGIVHRLDQHTSGILLVARTMAAYTALTDQFKRRTLKKGYLAFVYGKPERATGTITLPISRHPVHRKKMAIRHDAAEGRPAETRWTVLHHFGGFSLLHFELKTGRTHQIRVHAAAIGHPVVGDPTYGFKNPLRHYLLSAEQVRLIRQVTRQQLHARTIGFIHPQTGNETTFEAPMPPDMANLYQAAKKLETGSF
ncbi:MAG: RluA family pseudouridine synthase [Thermodesulfobacteriota bacterium]